MGCTIQNQFIENTNKVTTQTGQVQYVNFFQTAAAGFPTMGSVLSV